MRHQPSRFASPRFTAAVKDGLLKKYWRVPDAQIEGSVVLANVAVDRLRY